MFDEFSQLVSDYAAGASLTVLWPGTKDPRPATGTWLEVQWEQNGTDEETMADDEPAVDIGMFRVLACSRPGVGVVASSNAAHAVRDAIPKGTQCGKATITATPSLSGPVQNPSDQVIMTTVNFRYITT